MLAAIAGRLEVDDDNYGIWKPVLPTRDFGNQAHRYRSEGSLIPCMYLRGTEQYSYRKQKLCVIVVRKHVLLERHDDRVSSRGRMLGCISEKRCQYICLVTYQRYDVREEP